MGGVGGLTLVASLAAALSHRTSASRPPLSSRSTLPRLPSSSSACLVLRPSFLDLASSPGIAFRIPRRCFSVSFLDWSATPLSAECPLSEPSSHSVRACARRVACCTCRALWGTEECAHCKKTVWNSPFPSVMNGFPSSKMSR